MFNISTISDILKYDYRDPVRDQLNSATILLSRLKRTRKEAFQGYQAYIPLRKGRNVGIGSRPESGTLPTAGNQQYTKALYNVLYTYATIKLTGPAIAAARNDVGSFVRGLQSEMDGAMRDIKTVCNRQLWHDGSSILTRCGTTGASTTVVVESTKFLKEFADATNGMSVDIRVITDGTLVATKNVETVPSETTFTVTGAVTTSNLHCIVPAGGRGTSAWANQVEMYGLEAIVSAADPGNGLTADVGGISRDTNLWWKANSVDNGGTLRDLTLDLMQEAYDDSEIEGDTVPGLILTNHPLKRRYGALLVADKRYPPGGEITLDGGYKALEFNGVPLVADKDASATLTPQSLNKMYFLSMSSLEFAVMQDFDWLDRDGGVLKHVSSKDEWEAILALYANLVTSRANANTILADLRETA